MLLHGALTNRLLSYACSYGRVYATADPYHHTIGPAAAYSVGTMVRLSKIADATPTHTHSVKEVDVTLRKKKPKTKINP